MYTKLTEEEQLDNELAQLWCEFEQCLPRSAELEAVGMEKLFAALKVSYVKFRPHFDLLLEAKIKQERREYIKEVLLDFEKARMNGAPGYDFYFKLRTDLDKLNLITERNE